MTNEQWAAMMEMANRSWQSIRRGRVFIAGPNLWLPYLAHENGLALVETVTGRAWTVTHVRSGLAVSKFATRAAARKSFRKLCAVVPWSKLTGEEVQRGATEKQRAAIRAACIGSSVEL